MATQRIEEGEYGVEIVTAPTKPAVEESKKPVVEAPKISAPAATQAATVSKPAQRQAFEVEEVDEEDIYGEGTTFAAVKDENDGFQVEEGKQMTETLIVFERNQFLLYDFKTNKSWQVGDIENESIIVPEDSCIVMVDNQKHRTNLCQAILTGGFNLGKAQDQVLALGFDVVTKNAIEVYICNILSELPELPAPRYMHQAVIAKGKTGSWTLFVVGGKSDARSWHNTVWSLDLLPYFKTGVLRTNEDGTTQRVTSEWQICSPMEFNRSNFAMISLRNYIYVYGGISGASTGQQSHYAQLASAKVECYTIANNSWETITINTAPRLAAFSWCQLGDSSKIAVVGGTNGDIMSDETCIIDLQDCTVQNSSFEFNTCMGRMCFSESKNTLYHIGGMNSEGLDFKVTLDDTKRRWVEIEHNHSLVLNATKLELCNAPSVYFC